MIKSKILILALVVLVVVIFSGSYILLKWNPQIDFNLFSGGEENMPKATGSIEDLEASIEGLIDAENSFYDQEDADVAIGLEDVNEINDFGQIVDENEF